VLHACKDTSLNKGKMPNFINQIKAKTAYIIQLRESKNKLARGLHI
jgi:hypothetical protein